MEDLQILLFFRFYNDSTLNHRNYDKQQLCLASLKSSYYLPKKKKRQMTFFCVQNRQNPFKFSYILSIDKKVCMCNVVVKGLFNSPLMHLH